MPPERLALAATIRYLPLDVAAAEAAGGSVAGTLASSIHTELHGVANRLPRVLTETEARLGALLSHRPRAAASPLLLQMVEAAAARLADAVEHLTPIDWHRHCVLGDERMSLQDLVALPLHRHHARTARGEVCT